MCFDVHPKEFKTKLVTMSMKFNLLPRAAKKANGGKVFTFLECFGLPKNIDSLLTAFHQNEQIRTIPWITTKKQMIFLILPQLKALAREIQEFLISKDVIQTTEEYMKRLETTTSDWGVSFDKKKDLDLLMSTKEHMLMRIFTNLKTYASNATEAIQRLSMKIGYKLNQKTKIEFQGEMKPPSSASSISFEFESPLELECSKIGKENAEYFFFKAYPSEPPTIIFAKILHIYQNIPLKEVLLFNEKGRQVNNIENIKELNSLKLFYFFQHEIDLYKANNTEIVNVLEESVNYNYALSVLAGKKWTKETLLKVMGRLSLQSQLDFLKISEPDLANLLTTLEEIGHKDK